MHQETLVLRQPNISCAVTVQVVRLIGISRSLIKSLSKIARHLFRYWTTGLGTPFWLRLQPLDRVLRRQS